MRRRDFIGGFFVFSILPIAKFFEPLSKSKPVYRHMVEYFRRDGDGIDFFQVEEDMKSWVNTDRYMAVFNEFRESGRILDFNDHLSSTVRTFAFDFRSEEDFESFLVLVRPHANHRLREELGYAMRVSSSWT